MQPLFVLLFRLSKTSTVVIYGFWVVYMWFLGGLWVVYRTFTGKCKKVDTARWGNFKAPLEFGKILFPLSTSMSGFSHPVFKHKVLNTTQNTKRLSISCQRARTDPTLQPFLRSWIPEPASSGMKDSAPPILKAKNYPQLFIMNQLNLDQTDPMLVTVEDFLF